MNCFFRPNSNFVASSSDNNSNIVLPSPPTKLLRSNQEPVNDVPSRLNSSSPLIYEGSSPVASTPLSTLALNLPSNISNQDSGKLFFFFSFRPFPLVRGDHSVSSFSTSFCLQHPSPSHQLPAYLPLLHLKIFSLVSLFSSFPVTPFPSFFFLHTLGLSS